MTKWRLIGEVCLWQAFCFRNHKLRTLLELYKSLNLFLTYFLMDFKQISERISELIS